MTHRFQNLLCIGLTAFFLVGCQTWETLKKDFETFSLDNFGTASIVGSETTQSDRLIGGDCPGIEIVDDLAEYALFVPNLDATNQNLIAQASMTESQSSCEYKQRSVTIDLKLAFHSQLGPRASLNNAEFSYPYFVAVTDNGGKILAKEIFTIPISHNDGSTAKKQIETLRQIIPTDSRLEGSRYKVMVGFQLSENQLNYNRQVIEEKRLAAIRAEELRLEQERIAEQQRLEQERIAAQKATQAAEAAKAATNEQKIIIEKTMDTTTPPVQIETEALRAPEIIQPTQQPQPTIQIQRAPPPQRDGPFDMFKTE